MIVSDVMTEEVHTLSPHTPLKEAARRMVSAEVSGMPVVDDDGRVVGVLTESDFINPHAKGPRARRLLHAIFGDGENALAEAEVTEQLMTREVLTVSPKESVRSAARLMAKESVKRLPVVNDGGNLVGIVSRADLLKTFARSDADIRSDIDELVRSISLPIHSDQLEITVDDGAVTLGGKVETSGDAEILEKLIERLEGVTRVDNQLAWEVDLSRPEQKWPGFDQEGAPGRR